MKQFTRVYLLFILLILFSCQRVPNKPDTLGYIMKDYLQVGEYWRQVEKEAQVTGIVKYPYIIEISRGPKQLTFVGTRHIREITQQADSIDNAFRRLQPQIAFNEGGQVKQTYANRNEAIYNNGESGQVKYLCDSLGIKMLDGDLDVASEINALFEKHGRKKVLLYLANERFFDLYSKNWMDTTAGVEKSYQNEFIGYLQRNGVKLQEEEKEFSYIQSIYKNYFKEPLNIHAIPAEKFYFLNDGGEFTEIGRSSKMIRDIHLLKKIEQALTSYDKVFVVFGGAHAVAVEPALHQIMEKQASK